MRREHCMARLLLPACLTLGACPLLGTAARPVAAHGSLSFGDAAAREKFEAYVAFLRRDPERHSIEVGTIEQLERSEVQYCVRTGGAFGEGVEGQLTTDGQRVLISLPDEGGPFGEAFSLNSRFAHELEHARQFDSGEFAFVRDAATGRWYADPATYDIGDEVKAWSAQLRASVRKDLWSTMRGYGAPQPTMLQRFAEATTEAERAGVLRGGRYGTLCPVPDRNVVVSAAGYRAGQLLRPSAARPFFGRISRVQTSQ